jgi:hypothetical protein
VQDKVAAPGKVLTYTGTFLDPLNPDPDDIKFDDIAHALAFICRYTGHSAKFYSVAEHSVRISELLEEREFPKEVLLQGLLHDASEAYLGDISYPIKHQSDVGDLFREYEDKLMGIIFKKFDLPWPPTEEIKWADKVLLHTEQRDLMPYPNKHYSLEGYEVLETTIRPWQPEQAEAEFHFRYESLNG